MDNEIIDLEEPIINYPHVSARIKAAFVEAIIIMVMMGILTSFFESMSDVPNWARISGFIFIFGFYDPIFTSTFGGTIGHMLFKIRVKRINDESKNVILPAAVVRFLLKVILGWISLVTVGSDKKNRAIHDNVAGSLVVYAS